MQYPTCYRMQLSEEMCKQEPVCSTPGGTTCHYPTVVAVSTNVQYPSHTHAPTRDTSKYPYAVPQAGNVRNYPREMTAGYQYAVPQRCLMFTTREVCKTVPLCSTQDSTSYCYLSEVTGLCTAIQRRTIKQYQRQYRIPGRGADMQYPQTDPHTSTRETYQQEPPCSMPDSTVYVQDMPT
eukprot:jgi/Botrbrau1/23252/Bobra.0805s0001.1